MIEGASGAEDRVRAARALLQSAEERGMTLAIAESLTGGQVASSLVEVPGASRVLVGAVVAYATRIKAQVLGVDAAHLELTGPVDRDVALQMAHGVRRLLGADLADGHPAGTVHIAVVAPWGQRHRELHLSGDRSQIRCATVMEVCELAIGFLQKDECGPQP